MSSHVSVINQVTNLVGKVFEQPKGDFADRLNSRITVVILALSAALVYGHHFMGEPITCMIPPNFNGPWIQFVNQYCYVQGTYFAVLDQQLEFDDNERRKHPINYYQWVPYVLAAQAFFFYLPRVLWKTLASYSACADKFEDAAIFIWGGLLLARKRMSRNMAHFYVGATFYQALNAWSQWIWWNSLLGSPHYYFWGPKIVSDLISGNDWQKTGHFPRLVHCDFHNRRPASVQLDTVLCVLGLNIYYEKLFIFLWFWLLFVAFISSLNCCRWLFYLLSDSSGHSIIKNYLSSQPSNSQRNSHVSLKQFYHVLGKDGRFVLQQMSENLGDMPTSYLTIAMHNSVEMMITEDFDYSGESTEENVNAHLIS